MSAGLTGPARGVIGTILPHLPLGETLVTLRAALFTFVCLTASAASLLQPPTERDVRERNWHKDGRVLLEPPLDHPEGAVGRMVTIARPSLIRTPVYLRERRGPRYFLADDNGALHGHVLHEQVVEQLQLLLADGEITIFADQAPVFHERRAKWDLFWLAGNPAERPSVTSVAISGQSMRDSFMREELLDFSWQAFGGDWQFRQYGKGLAVGSAARDSTFERAVNPFSVRSSQPGVLAYGETPMPHGYCEARFYFGVPRTTSVIDTTSFPEGNLLVGVGDPAGVQAVFGWFSESREFGLAWREDPQAAWQFLSHYTELRPPLTNWARIGLSIRHGYALTGELDGVAVTHARAPRLILGPPLLVAGEGLIELDDVRAESSPGSPARAPGALFERSRQFSAKKTTQNDSKTFKNWTQGNDAFLRHSARDGAGRKLQQIHNRLPVFGDFDYKVLAYDAFAGPIPHGRYRFEFAQHRRQGSVLKPHALLLIFTLDDTGWTPAESLPGWTVDQSRGRLAFRRREGRTVQVQTDSGWRTLLRQLVGPVSVRISHAREPLPPAFPNAAHHRITAATLVTELFERAATDWSWFEGAFRMDTRWACLDRWNFMACGGTGAPFIVSKAQFHGDQEHEYFMTLRPAMPWDAGDADFVYDAVVDKSRKFAIFHRNDGWYSRRDLNFSFCTDGRNPLSGYSVVFGGRQNTRALLLRHGVVVAESTAGRIPSKQQDIHWRWWQFHVSRHGSQVNVTRDGKSLFNYIDRNPLTGGHTMYWTVRNGFVLARMTSTAEDIQWHPHVAYISNQQTESELWKPLLRDSVTLGSAAPPFITAVTTNSGAGKIAVRYTPETLIDLADTPLLTLPVEVDHGISVNLFLQISGQSYVCQLRAPITETASLLTPRDETGEQFRRGLFTSASMSERSLGEFDPTAAFSVNLREAVMRLPNPPARLIVEALTIGNTSNADYLMVGQTAGQGYRVGTPVWSK